LTGEWRRTDGEPPSESASVVNPEPELVQQTGRRRLADEGGDDPEPCCVFPTIAITERMIR
jgi:hypothetical protein